MPLNIRKVPKAKQKTLHPRRAGEGRPGRPQRPLPAPALRRPAAARRPGPGARLLPDHAAARRAAVQPGRQAPRAGPCLAQAPAGGAGHHHRLRHPRPGRGARAQRPDRGHVRRPHDAGRAPRTRSTRRPATPEVAAFVGRCNFLTGQGRGAAPVELHQSDSTPAATSSRSTPSQRSHAGHTVTVAIRPERLEVVAGRRRGPRVEPARHRGAHQLLRRVPLRVRRQLGHQVVQVESQRPA